MNVSILDFWGLVVEDMIDYQINILLFLRRWLKFNHFPAPVHFNGPNPVEYANLNEESQITSEIQF